jgi:hypothetical protein
MVWSEVPVGTAVRGAQPEDRRGFGAVVATGRAVVVLVTFAFDVPSPFDEHAASVPTHVITTATARNRRVTA